MFDLEYKPHKLMDPTNRIGAEAFTNTETMLNDCLVKSVNQMIWWKFFTCKRQTSRLMRVRLGLSEDRANFTKIEFGLSITAFRDFFVKDHKTYSLKKVDEFASENVWQQLEDFVHANMEKT